jgi:diguanylate cyclase (GGDEF)-like protein
VEGHRPTHYVTKLLNGRIISVSIEPMPDGGYVTTHQDVTEKRRAEERIAHMAMHDSLTDLPNRLLLKKRLERALASVYRNDGGLAALAKDLDRFKEVNDTLGHAAGDTLLQCVAQRLRDCTRDDDTVARVGGDEFLLLAPVTQGASEAAALAKRIILAIETPFEIEEHQITIGASLGIALAPDDSAEPDDLLKKADLALYRTKTEGRGTYRFFAPEMDLRMKARRALERDPRSALPARRRLAQ